MSLMYVGLSGGVDSAVSAYLLKKEGHDVTGVFIKGWEPDFLPCTGTADRLSAMQVAAHLGIPFKTYDLSEEYKKSVVDYFVAEYKAGRTPNPDVMCNRTIKFGAMWERARSEGADYVATGHYADTNGVALRASKDASKNQTYFLWTLTKDDLAHVRFPLGKLTKPEVRALAKKVKLPNAVRPDSQGLCFLGHVDMQEFLKRYIPVTPGPVVTVSGETVGTHDGVWFYTLGQHVSVSLPERVYVVEKRVVENTLVVSHTPLATEETRSTIPLIHENWISGEAPAGVVHVEYRYHGSRVRARIDGSSVILEKEILVAPGQSLVCYDQTGVVCLGGGIVA
jgi:tRNA-specific 2-thiouridylase